MTARVVAETALQDLRRRFCGLDAPTGAEVAGLWQAEFIGPAWLRRLAPPALALSGLAGWWGKTFDGQGRAANIVVLRGGARSEILPMVVVATSSLLDGRPSLTLHYPAGSPLPWRWMADEIRKLDDHTFMCLSRPRWRPIVGLALPFLLRRAHHA